MFQEAFTLRLESHQILRFIFMAGSNAFIRT